MIRKVIKIGNSEGVTIPVSVMRSKKLNLGDRVEVYVGKPGGHIRYIRLLKELEEYNRRPAEQNSSVASKTRASL